MDTAREAGARGGTIIRARWAGAEDDGQFYGISLQSEKEIIAIVAPREQRNAIMEVVNKKHGLKTEAGAVICSLGIDRMVKLAYILLAAYGCAAWDARSGRPITCIVRADML